MRKIYCDRCGREVDREESRIVPSFTTWDVARYMRRKLPLEMQQLAGKDFCRDCIADIVEFALNEKARDECVQQMMEENAVLREEDEKAGSDSRESAPGQFSVGSDRDGVGRPRIQYAASTREVEEVMRLIRREHQCQSGQS